MKQKVHSIVKGWVLLKYPNSVYVGINDEKARKRQKKEDRGFVLPILSIFVQSIYQVCFLSCTQPACLSDYICPSVPVSLNC